MDAEHSFYNFFGTCDFCEYCLNKYKQFSSIFVYLILPALAFATIWLRKEVATQILVQIDGIYIPICCSAFGKGKAFVEWAKQRLPKQWSSNVETLSGGIGDFWKDGSLLCTLINSSIPGACTNPYRHWKKPPMHAQDVAFKYLGVKPAFHEKEFAYKLSPYIEGRLYKYLHTIKKSISKTEKETMKYNSPSSIYVARGMGLYTAKQFTETEFFIYSKYNHMSFLNIDLTIQGPYSTSYQTNVLEYLTKQRKTKNLQKMYDSTQKNINVEMEIEKDRLRVKYVSSYCGIHEINLRSNKQSILGSPFYVDVINYSTISTEISSMGPEYCLRSITEDLKKIQFLQNNSVSIKKSIVKNCRMLTTELAINDKNIVIKKLSLLTINKNKYGIGNDHPMEITKYLKDLNNVEVKQMNQTQLVFMAQEAVLTKKTESFIKENYSYFQQLADDCFRVSCRITRATPAIAAHRKITVGASPICSAHIVSEDLNPPLIKGIEKDNKKKLPIMSADFHNRTLRESTFSSAENLEELQESADSSTKHKNSTKSKIQYQFNELNVSLVQHDLKTLQKVVKEKKRFWETAFVNGKNKKKYSDMSRCARKHKPTDSLYLLRKNQFSKSMSDIHDLESDTKMTSYRSFENHLDLCHRICLKNRMKLYVENAKLANVENV